MISFHPRQTHAGKNMFDKLHTHLQTIPFPMHSSKRYTYDFGHEDENENDDKAFCREICDQLQLSKQNQEEMKTWIEDQEGEFTWQDLCDGFLKDAVKESKNHEPHLFSPKESPESKRIREDNAKLNTMFRLCFFDRNIDSISTDPISIHIKSMRIMLAKYFRGDHNRSPLKPTNRRTFRGAANENGLANLVHNAMQAITNGGHGEVEGCIVCLNNPQEFFQYLNTNRRVLEQYAARCGHSAVEAPSSEDTSPRRKRKAAESEEGKQQTRPRLMGPKL